MMDVLGSADGSWQLGCLPSVHCFRFVWLCPRPDHVHLHHFRWLGSCSALIIVALFSLSFCFLIRLDITLVLYDFALYRRDHLCVR